MLDDWNTQLQLTAAGDAAGGLSDLAGVTTGAVEATPADLFSLDHRAELLARGRGHAVAFTVCNDALLLATSRNFVLRHDLSGDGGAVAELEVSRSPDARVRRLFVDPLGRHALLTLQTGGPLHTYSSSGGGGGGLLGGGGGGSAQLETFYLDGGLKKARPLPKLRGVAVTSVAWSPQLRPGGFSEALLGTDGGTLLELSLDEGGGGRKERLRQLHQLEGEAAPVAGLAQVLLGPGRRLVLALCGPRLHAFAGGPTLEALFSTPAASAQHHGHNNSENRSGGSSQGQGQGRSGVVDLPTQGGGAQLQLLYPPKQPDPGQLGGWDGSTSGSTGGGSTSGGGTGPGGVFEMPRPEAFAVLAPSGIYYGRLTLDPATVDPVDHLVKPQLLPAGMLHPAGAQQAQQEERPLSMALTQYHLVLLYPSKLQYVNRTSKAVVQEVPLQRFAAPVRGAATMPLGLCRDQIAGRIHVLAGDDVLEVDFSGEDRDMWRVLLDKGDYTQALVHCRSASQRNSVYLGQAAALFEEGRYVEAAQLYGKVTCRSPSFEDVALRLMEAGDPQALAAFLQARLDTLGKEDMAQATMVATWLTELLLDSLNRALLQQGAAEEEGEEEGEGERGRGQDADRQGPGSAAGGGGGGGSGGTDADGSGAYKEAVDRLRSFLQRYVEVLDPGTTVGLLAGYGRLDELQHYARCRCDWEGLVEYLLQRGEAQRALDVLRRPSVSPELRYKYAPALVAAAPGPTVQAWMDAQPPLDPRRLLPALLHFGDTSGGQSHSQSQTSSWGGTAASAAAVQEGRAEALKYVRFCLYSLSSRERAVHNLAVALLSMEPEREQELLDYLAAARESPSTQHPHGRPLYDAVAALRLVRDRGCLRASVELCCEVGLYEDAVHLALTFDSDLAAAVARRPQGDEALSRKLWLAIARHVIETGAAFGGSNTGEESEGGEEGAGAKHVRGVGALLEASGGALHIEDVLPLFPDFVEIDAFKDAICSSLEAYNSEIEGLKREMQAATRTAQAIREDLARLEHRTGAVDASEPCARCCRPVGQPAPASAGPSGGALPRLYLFPTGNAFHASCLCAEVSELAPVVQRRRIASLAARLAAVPEGATSAPATSDAPAASVAELRQQLEEEVAVDDPFEGEIVVRHITRPFVAPEEAGVDSWAL